MKPLLLVICAVIAGSLPAAAAEDAAKKGLEIARTWYQREQGFGDSVAKAKMILANRQGATAERRMRLLTLDVQAENEGDKSIVIFDYPRDIAGTALLSFARNLEPDDQWLYLPALKRVKRISSGNKSGPFVGSEFAYEDITSQELGKFDYKWVRDEPCGDLLCFVLDQYPLYEKSGYTKQVVWYDTKQYRRQRIDFYDRRGALVKTLTFSDYKLYENRFWRALKMVMVNHQTGKTTQLIFESYAFRTGLSDEDFTRSRLERMR